MANPAGKNQYSKGGISSKKKGKKGGPLTQTTGGKMINRVDAAAVMFGTGSKQHMAAKKKFG